MDRRFRITAVVAAIPLCLAFAPVVHASPGGVREPGLVELRLKGIGRDGRPASGRFQLVDVNDGNRVNLFLGVPGNPGGPCLTPQSKRRLDLAAGPCALVPPGTYSVLGHLATLPSWQTDSTARNETPLHYSFMGDPEIAITKDTGLTLDARQANEVKIGTPRHETKRNLGAARILEWHRAPARGAQANDTVWGWPGGQLEERLFLQPMKKVRTGKFAVATRWRLEAPTITMRASGGVRLDPKYYAPHSFSNFISEFPRLNGRARLRVADAGTGDTASLAGRDLRGKLALIRRSDQVPVARQANNAAAAGAKFVAIYNDKPGPNIETGDLWERLKVPTVWLAGEEGKSLLDRASRHPVTVHAYGNTASPYAYDLVYTERGGIPSELNYVADPRQLARVENRFHSQLAGTMEAGFRREHWQPWYTASYTSNEPVEGAPRERIDYVTADPELKWTSGATTPSSAYNNVGPPPPRALIRLAEPRWHTYRPGERARTNWLKAPLMPGPNAWKPLSRQGDLVEPGNLAGPKYQAFTDADGNSSLGVTSEFPGGFATDLRWYQGDKLIFHTKHLPVPDDPVRMSPDPARYRIEYAVNNNAPWARLSTRTRAVWSFASSRPPAGKTDVLPLPLIDVDAPVDLENRLRGRGPHRLAMSVRHQPGAPQTPIRSLTVAASYDGGASWRDVRVHDRGDGAYTVWLNRAPHGARTVSLKLGAQDAQGNGLNQEIINALGLSR